MPGYDPDEEATRPAPSPLDRPWIHPSELSRSGLPDGRSSTPTSRTTPSRAPRSWRRDLGMTLTAGTMGAVVTVAILGIVGALDPESERTLTGPEPGVETADAAAVAARVAPGIAAVIATGGGIERRGSGIVVGDHTILTTTAVLGTGAMEPGQGTVEICFANGRRHPATEIGRDAITGLAVLEVPTLRAQPAMLTNSEAVRAGDWIAAVGRTGTSGKWVTSGVVTAVGGWVSDDVGTQHAGMITTSIGVATEAHGGALLDRKGHIVGILTLSGTAPIRTAAIPSGLAREVADQLTETGIASHGALGIRAGDTKLPGTTIHEITAASGADRAGLLVGDRIVAVNGVKIPDTAALVAELLGLRSESTVRVQIVRHRQVKTVKAVLDDAAISVAGPVPLTG